MGIKFNGKYKGAMYYTTQAEGPERSFFSNEVSFGADVNLARVLNLDALDGLSLFGNFRYRDSVRHESDVNTISVEGDSMFQPNHMYSGTQFRVTSFGLNYSTKNLLPVEDMIVLRAGWLQPSREFVDQPLSKLFLNNAIESSKGIGGNIKFSSSYTAWGGTVEIKPIKDVYIKNGLFMATYNATETGNHGLGFRGYSPDTDRNGLWYMGETGYKPKIGSSKLEGKYAFGGYFFGTPVSTRTGKKTGGSKTYTGELEDGRNGLYIQADQMLFREPSEDASKLSKEGLSVFNLFSFAPDYAENGAAVALGVSTALPGVRKILILIEKNPASLAASFEVSEWIEANFSTRVGNVTANSCATIPPKLIPTTAHVFQPT